MRKHTRNHRHWAGICSCVSIAIAVGVIFSGIRTLAGEEPAFQLSRLSVADELLDIVAEDLNADGLKDILITHRKGLRPKETRWVSVFWQRAEGGFPTAADQSWELDTLAVILDVGDVVGDTCREICVLKPDEVAYYPLVGNVYETVPRRLCAARGMTLLPAKRRIPMINIVRDWNQDGRDEVAVMEFDALSIYARNGRGEFVPTDRIPVRVKAGMRLADFEGAEDEEQREDALTPGLQAVFSFPDLRLADFDSDGRRDIIATEEDYLYVFHHGADGGFSTSDRDIVFFDVRTVQEKIESTAEVGTVVTDLNADGYADAVVTKQSNKGLSSFRGVINVFWGRPDGYVLKPDQVIISEGTASSRIYIRDVNGDGRQDLILPSVKISITAIIRWLITRNIPIAFNIFLLGADGRFPAQPDFTKEVKLKIDWSGEADSQAMDLDGDYNGDKRKDFVFATDEDVLALYLGIGGSDELFTRKPVAEVTADAFGELSSPDLNNDGYSDMIIYYPQGKDRKGLVEVLMNQRRLK